MLMGRTYDELIRDFNNSVFIAQNSSDRESLYQNICTGEFFFHWKDDGEDVILPVPLATAKSFAARCLSEHQFDRVFNYA